MTEEQTPTVSGSVSVITMILYFVCTGVCYVPLIIFGITSIIDWFFGMGAAFLIAGVGFLAFTIYGAVDLAKKPRFHSDPAINQALQSYKKNKKNDTLLTVIIQQLIEQDRNTELLWVVEDALKITPKKFDLLYYRGTLLFLKGEVLESIEALKLALKYNKNDYFALCNLGSNLFLIMRYEEAKEYLQRALVVNPTNFQAHEAMGGIYIDQMKWDDARIHLEKAYADSPNSDTITFSLCVTYSALKQTDKAMKYLEEAIKLNPKKEEYQIIKKELVAKDFDFNWFINELNTTGPRKKENFLQLKIDTSSEFCQQGMYEEAYKGYNIILAIDPTNFFGLKGKIDIFQRLRRMDESEKLAKEAYKLYPDKADFLVSLANVATWYSQIGKAKRLVTKAIENDTNYAPAHVKMAVILEAQKEFAEALIEIEKAVRLEPDNEEFQQLKSRIGYAMQEDRLSILQ